MILDFLKGVWLFINNIDTQLKTLVIIILFCYVSYPWLMELNQKTLVDYFEEVLRLNVEDENYTLRMSHYINEYVHNIELGDKDCFNVLLLNYHNSLLSLLGFRYLYLNCLTESPKGLNDEHLKLYWNDLEYIYYLNELDRIRNNGYLRIQDIDSIKADFPRLYKKLLVCEAKAAAFYPIEGMDSPIGLIVILYKKPKEYELGYYNSNISPWILKLSIILDYLNVKQKIK